MHPIAHIAIASLYCLLAAIVCLLFWSANHEIGPAIGATMGGLVLLAGMLMHDNLNRRRKQQKMDREIHSLKDAFYEVSHEMRFLRDELSRPPRTNLSGGAEVEYGEFIPEVRELQKLLERVSEDRSPEAWEAAMSEILAANSRLTPEQREQRRILLGGEDETRILKALEDALRYDRMDLFLQPVVSLPARRRFFLECSCHIRLPEGNGHLAPEQYMQVARDCGLIGHIQNLLLIRTVQLVRSSMMRNQANAFFCHIAAETLMEPEFLLDLVALLERNSGFAQRMVFGIAQKDLPYLSDQVNKALFRLAGAGYRFCLDEVENLRFNLDDLRDRKFRFVKVAAPLLMVQRQKAESPTDPRDFHRLLERNALDMIVERIDDEDILKEVLDYEINYGQGFLFGKPLPVDGDGSIWTEKN